jgi:predicted helicase
VARNNSRSKLERFVKLVVEENGSDIALFDTHSLGLYAGRDPYAYNFSKDELRKHMERLIDTFNEHLERVWAGEITKDNLEERIERDDRKIKWDSSLKDRLLRLGEKQTYKEEKVYPAFYRPFAPMWVYFDGVFNGSISRLPSIFPTPDAENLAIVISGRGADWFDAFITDRIVDYGFMYNTQIFPLYIYTETFQKQYNISDNTLRLFREKLDDSTITKEDIFFYVFGLLSTPFYVKRFRNNLSKQLPRVPILRSFKKISRLGRQLAGVQLIYQQYVWAVVMKEEKMGFVEYTIVEDDELLLLLAGFYPILNSQAFMWWDVITKDEAAKRNFPILIADGSNLIEYVEKVKLDKENRELLINEKIKVINIPKFALEFKVGNCSPIEWVSRYLVRQENKETGIVWNPRLRVEKFIDIVRKLISFSWMCLKIKDDLNNLYFIRRVRNYPHI